LRWHRQLVAQKWDYSHRRKNVGRPRVSETIVELVLRMARENPTWGYDRIEGALANLGHKISDTTVGNILREHGIEPAPERKRQSTWKAFLMAHWDVLGATDFTTIEVWTKGGLVTIYLLFVMEVGTRRVHFAGSTTNPAEAWMKQIARNLTDNFDGFLLGKRYLLMDRDTKFCESFRSILLRAEERNHQGLDNRLIAPGVEVGHAAGSVECRERLGGLLRYYYRDAVYWSKVFSTPSRVLNRLPMHVL
jgi:hypothetical protein